MTDMIKFMVKNNTVWTYRL